MPLYVGEALCGGMVQQISVPVPVGLRSHCTRAKSVSMAYLRPTPTLEIYSAATCSLRHTLTKPCSLDLAARLEAQYDNQCVTSTLQPIVRRQECYGSYYCRSPGNVQRPLEEELKVTHL